MIVRSKKDVLNSIGVYAQSRGGKSYELFKAFVGFDSSTRKQIRLFAKTRDKLREKVNEFYKRLSSGGEHFATMTSYEAMDARRALDLLAARKSNLSLYQCVEAATRAGSGGAQCGMPLGRAFAAFIESQIDKSDSYVKALKSRVGRWIAAFGGDRPLSDVSAAEVTAELKARLLEEDDQKTWKTYNNHLGDIKTFLSWCTKPEQGYLDDSPLEKVKGLQIAYKEPEYMKAEDVKRLFDAISKHRQETPEVLADAVLSFFCGMRQSEIDRVRDGSEAVKIDLENGFIRIVRCKGATKGVRPRAFSVSEQAAAWMRSFDFMEAVRRPNKQFRRRLLEYAKEAHIHLPKNAGRHTFITMHTAAYHDPNLLSSIVGNTEGVRVHSYDGVEVEKNGKAYFAIMPTAA